MVVWSGLSCTVHGDNDEAFVQLITDCEITTWSCRYGSEQKSFEEGKLEQAYEWCKTKLSSNEQRAGK
jgi:hypothetical protein